METEDHDAFMLNCSLHTFRQRFADEASGNAEPLRGASEVEPGNAEWQRRLLLPRKDTTVELLCCPEDVEVGRSCNHASEELCGRCRIPLCWRCAEVLRMWRGSARVAATGLCNDNLWGYRTDAIWRYRAR